MLKKDWFVSIVAGLILGCLAIFAGINQGLGTLPVAKAEDQTGEIRNLMVKSHTSWQTIRGETTTLWLNPRDDSQQFFHQSIVIANPDRAHVTISSDDGSIYTEWIGDGVTVYEIDRKAGGYRESRQNDGTKSLERLPADIGTINGEVIFRHPLAMMIPSPVMDYIFPTGLAQREGEYTLIGEDTIVDRSAWIMDYLRRDDQGEVTMKARYWVDQKTGIILQAFTYSTEPEYFGELIEKTFFSSLNFDQQVQSDEFTPSLEGF
jgi:outer membrane lipoprotein-sorting protein